MITHAIFFYFFSIIAIFSALMVITSRSTINSVFFLILDFISVGCLFIMIGAEFLGMILLIVYVGAVAVLFLFVVMMLNVSDQKQSWFMGKKSTHIPAGLLFSVLIFLKILFVVGGWKYKDNLMSSSTLNFNSEYSNTHEIGNVMYTEYFLYFQISIFSSLCKGKLNKNMIDKPKSILKLFNIICDVNIVIFFRARKINFFNKKNYNYKKNYNNNKSY